MDLRMNVRFSTSMMTIFLSFKSLNDFRIVIMIKALNSSNQISIYTIYSERGDRDKISLFRENIYHELCPHYSTGKQGPTHPLVAR